VSARPRVLVVDDSAVARKVVREILERSGAVEVVGIARDGLDALERIAELRPDVVTLDLVMPDLDGVGVLRALAELPSPPRVIVVSASAEESELVLEALQLGAVDFVHKPTTLATDRLYELGAELVRKIEAIVGARPRVGATPRPGGVALAAPAPGSVELVVVGTSTGGPQALAALLGALPAGFPAALAIALHIPREYTPALARRLDATSALEVVEADEGLELRPGRVVLARGGTHLAVERRRGGLVATLPDGPATLHHPSVDVLFESAARACGSGVVGVVLTGMGDDGVVGARAIRGAGGRVLGEAESSCIVYGMPRAVREAGLSSVEAPLERMAEAIVGVLEELAATPNRPGA
jgi:two-component system chemotaxis response regulator CheB